MEVAARQIHLETNGRTDLMETNGVWLMLHYECKYKSSKSQLYINVTQKIHKNTAYCIHYDSDT